MGGISGHGHVATDTGVTTKPIDCVRITEALLRRNMCQILDTQYLYCTQYGYDEDHVEKGNNPNKYTTNRIKKTHTHSGCEIEDFVETHLCELCVILRSRVLRVVCPHEGYRSATPLATTV